MRNIAHCARSGRQIASLRACIAASTLLLLAAPTLLAQENRGDDSTVVYPASYFTEFQPVTAEDMVNRIPGLNVSRGGGSGNASRGGRGLGSGSGGTAIMINNRRVTGKNNSTQDQLSRISADQVEYVEIIRGTGGELDVRGSTQVVNVILLSELSASSISYEVNADYYADSESRPGGSLAYNGQSGRLNYLFNVSAEPRYNHQEVYEESILGDFSPNDIVVEDRIRDQTTYTLSSNMGYELTSNTMLRFNALYSQNDDPTTVSRFTTDLAAIDDPTYQERENIPGTRSNWEIGADIEHSFANGSRLRGLIVANDNNQASTRERFDVFSDGSEFKKLFLDSGNVITERIARASYTLDLSGNQDMEVGAEAAKTVLDSRLRLALPLSSGTPSPDFGGLVPVPVNNANTTVEEFRYEPFAIHNWQLTPRMSLESSLVYEYSEIEQFGEVNQRRDFDFFKPKFDYRFDITPQVQLRMMVEKNVRQINFVDFVAVTDPDDEDSNFLPGNRNLRPDYFWNYNLLAEYRLPDDIGVISANIYKHRHKDFRQRIDVSPSPDRPASAVGNIGDGDMWVGELRSSTRMKFINMPNLLVTTRATFRKSEVRDPFLGIDRPFDNFERGSIGLGFRHDIPSWRVNYGVNWNDQFDGNQRRYDIFDIESDTRDPFAMAFVEWVAFGTTRLRLDVRNLNDGAFCRERLRFVGHVRDGNLGELEKRCTEFGRVFTMRMSGTF